MSQQQIVLGALIVLCSMDCACASSSEQVFNVAAMLVVCREVIEGCIIVSVMLSALHKMGAESKRRWVWIGAASGMVVSIIIGIAFVALFWVASTTLLTGYSEQIFEAVLGTCGCVMVTMVSLKLLKFSDMEAKWHAKLKARGASAIDSTESTTSLSSQELDEIAGTNTEVFLVIFTTVVREGIETSLFVGGIGAGSMWTTLPLSAFVGLLLGAVAGIAIAYGGKKTDNLAWFFYFSCLLLFFIAAGLLTRASSQTEAIYTPDAYMDGSVVIGTPLWSIKACCDETQGIFAILRGIVGWRDSPTLVMVVIYLAYWISLTALLWRRFAVGSLFRSRWSAPSAPTVEFSAPAEAPDQQHMAWSKRPLPQVATPVQACVADPAPVASQVDAEPGGGMGVGCIGAGASGFCAREGSSGGSGGSGDGGGCNACAVDEGLVFIGVAAAADSMPASADVESGLLKIEEGQGAALSQEQAEDKAELTQRTQRNLWRAHGAFAAVQVALWGLLIAASVVAGLRAARGVRLYFVGAEPVEWDYAPSGVDGRTGTPFESDPVASPYMVKSERFVGRRVRKTLLRAYADKSFTQPLVDNSTWQHLGLLGPIIRAEVGDDVRVVFRNLDPVRTFSLNPRGLAYDKADEGMRYAGDAAAAAAASTVVSSSRRGYSLPHHSPRSTTFQGAGMVGHRAGGAVGQGHLRALLTSDTGMLMPGGEGDDTVAGASVQPNTTHVYEWRVPERAGPGPEDPSSVLWTYQSMVDWEFDLFTGMVGGIIVSRSGTSISRGGPPRDVDREFVLLFLNVNEDESHWRDYNIASLTPSCQGECHEAEDVAESMLRRSINGYMFDNLPGVRMVAGERVRFYLAAMGNEGDLHSVLFHGNTVLHQGHRRDSLELMPGTTATVDMLPDRQGKFGIECSVSEHFHAGMTASYIVDPPHNASAAASVTGRVREYFVAAEEAVWDYAPTGGSTVTAGDGFTMMAPDADFFARTKYRKARYVGYTDATFTTPSAVAAEWTHLGLLGPVIRAEVGDEIHVTFLNRASRPCSIRPQGLLDAADEANAAVVPGGRREYRFLIPERAGPGPQDGSSVAWLYSSGVDPVADLNAGLVGAVLVTRRGASRSAADPRPADVDCELVSFFATFDENQGWFAPPPANDGAEEDPTVDRKYAINGLIFGNNDGFRMALGDRARWYLLSAGDQTGMHTVHFHASTVIHYARRTDVIQMLPTSSFTVDMMADMAGRWLLHCHVSLHMGSGMLATYTVGDPSAPPPLSLPAIGGGRVRTYFVAAEEVPWDFAPTGVNGLTGGSVDTEPNPSRYLQRNDTRIGRRVRKARYVEYTDATFTQAAAVAAEWAHLGVLGPVLRAEVGDDIRVTFLNRCERPYTMHPHGVVYVKADEGANYRDGVPASEKSGAGVAPGTRYLYRWHAAPRSGPGPEDGSSVAWLYHSHVDESRDVAAGLAGAIIISRNGTGTGAGARASRPPDVDREFVMLFKVFDEATSWYVDFNVANLTAGVGAIRNRCLEEDGEASESAPYCPSFEESLFRHAINGYMYANVPALVAKVGERVRWYMLGLGTQFDMHGATWNGATVVLAGARRDQVALMPAGMWTADMVPDRAGQWLLKCQVTDHFMAGMTATYTVEQ